jgi:L-iditol 2-dehydrogenase
MQEKEMMRVTLIEPKKLFIDYTDIPSPGIGEVLIKVLRVGVCGSDWTIYNGKHPYVNFPIVLGHEFSGVIEKVGINVNGLTKGMRVTVIPHLVCGECDACKSEKYNLCEKLKCVGAEADGAYVQYKVMPAKMVIPIPDKMSMDEAAMVEPACVGYHGAKRGEINSGDNVLVIGAGPIGIFCMQSCKVLGADNVYIADLDEWRLNLALKLGADGIINVSKETLNEGLERLAGSTKKIDVFYDCVGEKGRVFNDILKIARRGSNVVVIGVLQKEYSIPLLPDFVQHELRISGSTMYTPSDYREIISLMTERKIKTEGIISHYYKLNNVKEIYDMIEKKKEKFFKIMINVNS